MDHVNTLYITMLTYTIAFCKSADFIQHIFLPGIGSLSKRRASASRVTRGARRTRLTGSFRLEQRTANPLHCIPLGVFGHPFGSLLESESIRIGQHRILEVGKGADLGRDSLLAIRQTHKAFQEQHQVCMVGIFLYQKIKRCIRMKQPLDVLEVPN